MIYAFKKVDATFLKCFPVRRDSRVSAMIQIKNEVYVPTPHNINKLLERGFLLCTASIYHCNNVIVDADICCARILRARALLWARYRPFRYVPRLQLVTMRRLQDAFGTIKSFPRSVFCSGQTVYIIYTGYTPRGSF